MRKVTRIFQKIEGQSCEFIPGRLEKLEDQVALMQNEITDISDRETINNLTIEDVKEQISDINTRLDDLENGEGGGGGSTEATPDVTTPVIYFTNGGSVILENNVAFNASAFETIVPDNIHIRSQWQIADRPNGNIFANINSELYLTEIIFEDLEILKPGGVYYLRVRYIGTEANSNWSKYVYFTPTHGKVSQPYLISPIENTVINNTATLSLVSCNFVSQINEYHVSSDYKICSDALGDEIVMENLDDTDNLLSYTFENLALQNRREYYLFTRHCGSVSGKSEWSLPVLIKCNTLTGAGRVLYRHSSNKGTVLECTVYGVFKRILVLDAAYRAIKPLTLEWNTVPDIPVYSSPTYINVRFEESMTDAELDDAFYTHNENLSPASITDEIIRKMPSNEVTAHCRSISINGKPCDMPTLEILARIYAEKETLDKLDPTIDDHPDATLATWFNSGVALSSKLVYGIYIDDEGTDNQTLKYYPATRFMSLDVNGNVSYPPYFTLNSVYNNCYTIPILEIESSNANDPLTFKYLDSLGNEFSYAVYRHSSGVGSVIEISQNDNIYRRVFVADAKYRTSSFYGNKGNIVEGIDLTLVPVARYYEYRAKPFGTIIDANSSKHNTDLLMGYEDFQAPSAWHCRRVDVSGTPCDLPSVDTAINIFQIRAYIDMLDPTVGNYPDYRMSNVNCLLTSSQVDTENAIALESHGLTSTAFYSTATQETFHYNSCTAIKIAKDAEAVIIPSIEMTMVVLPTPTVTSPTTNESVESVFGITVTGSPFDAGEYVDQTHITTDYKICSDKLGVNIVDSDFGSYDLTKHVIMGYNLENSTRYWIFIRYNSRNGRSRWSEPIPFSIKPLTNGKRKLYRHSSNKGTVMDCILSHNRKKSILILDAAYRTDNVVWSSTDIEMPTLLTNETDRYARTGYLSQSNYFSLPVIYDGFRVAEDTKDIDIPAFDSHTINSRLMTDAILAQDSAAEAARYCRGVSVDNTDCDLPDPEILVRIYAERRNIDALDPTVADYPQKSLVSWFTDIQDNKIGSGIAWANNSGWRFEYSLMLTGNYHYTFVYAYAGSVDSTGELSCNAPDSVFTSFTPINTRKNIVGGVIPIQELEASDDGQVSVIDRDTGIETVLYRHASDMGTVMETREGTRAYRIIVLDAAHRTRSSYGRKGNLITDIENYGGKFTNAEYKCYPMSYVRSTENTDALLATGAAEAAAASYCRGVTVFDRPCDLPSIGVLRQIASLKTVLDILDPTAAEHAEYSLSNWFNGGIALSSTQRDADNAVGVQVTYPTWVVTRVRGINGRASINRPRDTLTSVAVAKDASVYVIPILGLL